jgi:hypothetical protein
MSGLLNSMVAPDLYNLTMPVTPPADLPLANTDFALSPFMSRNGGATDVVGFDPRSAPYLRGLGFFANVADGLVSINEFLGANAAGDAEGVVLQLVSYSFSTKFGVINNTAGSANITGSGFSTLSPGSIIWWRDDNNVVRKDAIATVTNDTTATLANATATTGMYTANTTAARWREQNAGLSSLRIPLVELNRIYTFSFPLYNAADVPTGSLGTMVVCEVIGNLAFSTISVNPLYAAKRLIFHAVAEIEHTFGQTFAL